MSAIITLLLSLGIITQPEEATSAMIDQYGAQCNIVNDDMNGW